PRRRGKKDPENPQRVKQDQGESAEHRGREKGGGPGMSYRIQEERKRQKPDRHKGKGSEERGDQHRENATEDHPVADLAVRSRQVGFTSCSCAAPARTNRRTNFPTDVLPGCVPSVCSPPPDPVRGRRSRPFGPAHS